MDRDPRRRFARSERTTVYLAADARCPSCGSVLERDFHVDHRVPHARGGGTELANAIAACPTCNWKKGSNMPSFSSSVPQRLPARPLPENLKLRPWQRRALRSLATYTERSFLLNVAPGGARRSLLSCMRIAFWSRGR